MAASDHLSPQLFHGTAADLGPGDQVNSARDAKASSNWPGYRTSGGRSIRSVAFATTSEDRAWTFASYAQQKNGGRARVLQVDPHPDQEPGLHNPAHPRYRPEQRDAIPGETIAPHFKVAESVDIRPGHQGTFSNINWNQFSMFGPRGTYGDEINHPPDDRITEGHRPSLQNVQIYQESSGQTQADEVKKKIEQDQGRLF